MNIINVLMLALSSFVASASTVPPSTTCPDGQKRFTLALTADTFPSETSWCLINLNANVEVLSGDANGNTSCIDESQEYEFTIKDTVGDGICCFFGSGSYEVFYDDDLIKEGGKFGVSETVVFGETEGRPSVSPSSSPSESSRPSSSPSESSSPTTKSTKKSKSPKESKSPKASTSVKRSDQIRKLRGVADAK